MFCLLPANLTLSRLLVKKCEKKCGYSLFLFIDRLVTLVRISLYSMFYFVYLQFSMVNTLCCKVNTYYELLGDNINTIMYTFNAWFFKSCLLKDTFTVINGIPCTHVAYTCIYFGK